MLSESFAVILCFIQWSSILLSQSSKGEHLFSKADSNIFWLTWSDQYDYKKVCVLSFLMALIKHHCIILISACHVLIKFSALVYYSKPNSGMSKGILFHCWVETTNRINLLHYFSSKIQTLLYHSQFLLTLY